MTTVLIPTDFTLQSLNMVKTAAARFGGEKLNIVLFHALHMPTDIQDLLFLNKQVPNEKITEDFRHACMVIKKRNSDVIAQINFHHLYGNTSSVFRNFIDANSIDVLFMPQHVTLTQAYDNSVDVRTLFKKATIPFITEAAPVTEAQKYTSQEFQGNMALSEG